MRFILYLFSMPTLILSIQYAECYYSNFGGYSSLATVKLNKAVVGNRRGISLYRVLKLTNAITGNPGGIPLSGRSSLSSL